MRIIILLVIIGVMAGCQSPLQKAVEAPHRTPEFVERDRYRHPEKTLTFFDIRQDMTVVEIWPGPKGWYSEVLAPLLRDKGILYAAQFPPDSGIGFYTRSLESYREKLAAKPDVYGNVKITYLYPPKHTEIAPEKSADAVLTFRNVHNWAKAGRAEKMFESFFAALKPGGILGVVEHRATPGTSLEKQIESGYMTEAYVIEKATDAGFVFEASSEVNANPKDDHDHPAGVWTLPPTLRLGDDDRDIYLSIGESDRMTLKFRKPK